MRREDALDAGKVVLADRHARADGSGRRDEVVNEADTIGGRQRIVGEVARATRIRPRGRDAVQPVGAALMFDGREQAILRRADEDEDLAAVLRPRASDRLQPLLGEQVQEALVVGGGRFESGARCAGVEDDHLRDELRTDLINAPDPRPTRHSRRRAAAWPGRSTAR